jgi:putative membrane protein
MLGMLFGFAVETLVLWSTSNIKYIEGVLISAIQPILTISMWILINNLTLATPENVYSIYMKAIIGALVLAIAVYAFVAIIESPIKSNLGVGGLELLSLFIAQVTEGSIAMEEVFSEMGENIDTIVSLISFKTKKGIKANYISPCVHPGPVGNIGGGNLPRIMANQLDDFSIIAHGAATHDFNPVASKEVSKITEAINEVLPTLNYSNKATKFQRVQYQDSKIGVQFFDEGAILLSTFAPKPGDDIDYGVGLSMIYQTKYVTNVKDVVLVDCHNCLNGNYERLLPGHNRVLQIENAIDKIEKPEMYPIKMGYAYNPLDEIPIKDGIGESGVKIMITEVDNQKMLYIVFDGNNMQTGFREKLFDAIYNKYPDIDMIETMTTDTHMVNTISGGGLTVGYKHSDEIIQSVLELIPEALDDLEEVSVASATARVNIKTLGPNNSTELVTTISSVVSVSKLLAPLVFIIAAIITILWIF